MPAYLDDEAVTLAGDSLASMLDAAQQRLQAQGRIVVEVKLDGQPVSAQTWDEHLGRDMATAELRLYSADPRDLCRGTLEALLAALDDAAAGQAQAAELLQQDQPRQAMAKLGEVMELWQQSHQAVGHATTLLNVDLSAVMVNDQPAAAIVQHVADQLRAVRDAIQAGDMVALADNLAYEWPETTRKWQWLITRVIERIDALPG